MYQGLVFYFLGIRREKEELVINPATPARFGDYTVEYRYGTSQYRIRIESRSKGILKTATLQLDGMMINGNRVPLKDDGKEHLVIV
jgi:cellobiose phosphorylase